MQHEAEGGQGHQRLGDRGAFLVVLGQPPVAPQPTECSLNDPPPGPDDDSGAGDAADDDQRQAEHEAGDQDRETVVDTVGEDRFEPAGQPLDPTQQGPCAVSVLDVGGVDEDTEQEAGAVDRAVAFAPPQLCGRVVTPRPPFSGVLTLWVSMMAAVGLASRPSCSRHRTTRWGRRVSHTPAARKARK